jgi:2-oxoacid:acceptor oxidoreductase gamma subunit (pyruvate/2-ketoisovalerate family)
MSETQTDVIDIRFYGRGGQGVVTASRLVGEAGLLQGKYVHAFPAFGPERIGAPVQAFTRISNNRFYEKCEVVYPDIVCVLDPTLYGILGQGIVSGLDEEKGVLISNYKESPEELRKELNLNPNIKVGVVDATSIAIDVIGRAITNTVMLGALIKAVEVVDLENIIKVTKKRFPGEIGEKNAEAIRRAYNEVIIS